MEKDQNTFRQTARFYDQDNRDVAKHDIHFYLHLANQIRGDILELACGTGRVTIPIAKQGHEIWGLDLSTQMLAEFERKLTKLPSEITNRIHLMKGDMADFQLDRKFELIFIAFRSFQALTEDVQQRNCLACVHQHLADDGIFIINTFKPYKKLDKSWIHREELDWMTIDPLTKTSIRRTNIRRKIDTLRQIIYPELVYYVKEKDRPLEVFTDQLSLKYYYEDQLRDLLISSGFYIVKSMGYYDGRSIREGSELIFVCKKA